jgi:hypothetical protein
MIKLGGNQKHLAELAPRFPFLETIGQNWQPLRKRGEGQRNMMISSPSYRSRSQDMTRVSKSEKSHQAYYQGLKLLRKGELHEEKGTYISQVSIHAY